MNKKAHEREVLSRTSFVHKLSGCLRYSRETGRQRLTEARDFQLHPTDNSILVQPEHRTEGRRFGFSIFDDHFSWVTHAHIAGYPVAIQMLDRDQQASAWPTEIIGKKRIVVDILLAENMYLRMRPYIVDVQNPAYRLQLVNKRSATKIHHDSFRLQDDHGGTRPSCLVMLGRYFDPFLISPGETKTTQGRLFPGQSVEVGAGKYFWNGSSFFYHEQAEAPYKIESLVRVMDDQTQVACQKNKMTHTITREGIWKPSDVDRAAACAQEYVVSETDKVIEIELVGFDGCKRVLLPKQFVFQQPTLSFAIKDDEISSVVADLRSNIELLINTLISGNGGIFNLAALQGW